MCFVDPASGWYSAPVPAIICVIPYNIWPRYNGARLYYQIWIVMERTSVKWVLEPNGQNFVEDISGSFSWMERMEFWFSFHWSMFPRIQFGSDNSLVPNKLFSGARAPANFSVYLELSIYLSRTTIPMHYVSKVEYSRGTRSVPWLLMPWLLASPDH